MAIFTIEARQEKLEEVTGLSVIYHQKASEILELHDRLENLKRELNEYEEVIEGLCKAYGIQLCSRKIDGNEYRLM